MKFTLLLFLALSARGSTISPFKPMPWPVVSDPLWPDTAIPPVAPYGGLDSTGNIPGDMVFYPSDYRVGAHTPIAATPEPSYLPLILLPFLGYGMFMLLAKRNNSL